ncbi:hypothetical protein RRG08_007464 [Elysia crispata]|uniref:Uncharacterized protein n=1 Tax=Elysia crispata TaxID=231223 RepID=A0AAE0XN48_9GAST|nr:hypothetical protein RRG08_007464 [Elysia crispata]
MIVLKLRSVQFPCSQMSLIGRVLFSFLQRLMAPCLVWKSSQENYKELTRTSPKSAMYSSLSSSRPACRPPLRRVMHCLDLELQRCCVAGSTPLTFHED